MQTRLFTSLVYMWCWIVSPVVIASSHQDEMEEGRSDEIIIGIVSEENIVSYPGVFFEKFQPLTALDMVRQVPGFQLENNAAIRGFGNALGNLLINDRRPAAKQEQPNDILARIPASSVQRIELIRGQVRDIDLRGQSSLINIILTEDEAPAIKWEAYIRRTFGFGEITPSASIAVFDNWSGFDYSFGLSGRRADVGRDGTEDIFDDNNQISENWAIRRDSRNIFYKGNLDISRWLGQTFFRLNSNFSFADHLHKTYSDRIPTDPSLEGQIQDIQRVSEVPFVELGIDFERNLSQKLFGKMLFLFFRQYQDDIETLNVTNTTGNRTLLRIAETSSVTTEGISRMELYWAGIQDHTIQLNIEGIYNLLDGKYFQIDDRGLGPTPVHVPGANSKVEELRGDLLLQDTWKLGQFELEYGLGAETSTITQSGDIDQQRSLFFIKPKAILTYSPTADNQTRLRLAREVSQLDLLDFISEAVFEDDDLALGNPDIQPEATWLAEISHERRIGKESVVKLTLFQHWIKNVLDLLPLSSEFEVPGNIGDGQRWGIRLEASLPLDWTGLAGTSLKAMGRWQDSSVIDPVSGQSRILSEVGSPNEPDNFDVDNKYVYSIDFRQDFETARVAWGWTLSERAALTKFRVNELEIYDEGTSLNAFIETTRWLNVKTRFFAENILDFADTRERSEFIGMRDLSPLKSVAFRNQTRGARVFLIFSGTY